MMSHGLGRLQGFERVSWLGNWETLESGKKPGKHSVKW